MRTGFLLLAALLLSLSAGCAIDSGSDAGEAAAPGTPGMVLEDCQLTPPGLNLRMAARCGKLAVPEDPANPGGRTIELNIAVIPAISRNPAPDPVVFLAGGPGEAATESYPLISSAFDRLIQKRDILLVDQRGTGSSNPLECPIAQESEAEGTDLQAVLQSCLHEIPGDPRMYTTAIAMQDLDLVRQTLGYEQLNLYGASYGTRAALVYLWQFPSRVRTIILDGVAPPNWTLGPTVAADAQRALELLFARCAGQAECQEAFPNLTAEFEAVRARLEAGPVEVSLMHPITGQPEEFTLTLETFVSIVHTVTYSPESAAVLPLMIHNAAERQDYRLLAAQSLSTFDQVSESISAGMRFAVICAEDVPFFDLDPIAVGYLGDFYVKTFRDICENWPRGEIPAGFKEPVTGNVPVLLLSGEADPVTPPANAALAAESLPNSLQIVVPGQAHINIYRGCIPNLATDFITNASIEGLDLACVQEMAPIPFFVNYNGPQP